ncbi:MAG: hypothetical protein BWX88_01809 [Planctomycetes bacterium ADurb.Bin126]|nr:MAG: hypothetical protein BWX88_01809 [Planctomycetes bacterium ADurb.Bin126]HOD83943.1 cytochrome c [Phycisphaerae bacterium]
MWIAAGILLVLAGRLQANDQRTFARVCTRCHSVEGQTPSERSAKAWELTIERMARYAENNEMTAFTDREAEAVLRFLVSFPEGKVIELDHVTLPTSEPPAADASQVQPIAVQGQAAPAPSSQPTVATSGAASAPASAAARAAPVKLPPLPPPPLPMALLSWAKSTGYVALAILAALVFTGVTRRQIGRAFPRLHVSLAAMLALCAVFHSVVFVWRYGAPHILWFWFGLIALGVVVAALLGGAYRRRMHGLLFRLHKAAALVALCLTLLHWVWYYL